MILDIVVNVACVVWMLWMGVLFVGAVKTYRSHNARHDNRPHPHLQRHPNRDVVVRYPENR